MKKSIEIQSVDASTSAVPERVSVAMAEIGEGLLALAVGAGRGVVDQVAQLALGKWIGTRAETQVIELHVATAPGELDRVELGTSVNPVPDVEHVLVTAGTGVPTSGLILS
jgi:hypothetical protein